MTVPPGSTIGIIGGGQLGRMLVLAAAQLGYRCHVYAPDAHSAAAEVAAAFTQAAFNDDDALRRFAAEVDVITYEFENVDPHAVAYLATRVRVRPFSLSLDISRNRLNEKNFAASLGGTPTAYRPIMDLEGLKRAIGEIGTPSILKTTMFGYDGKGQAGIDGPDDAEAAWLAIGSPQVIGPAGAPAILEQRVDFVAEFSIILCRTDDGAIVVWDAAENVHGEGILRTSTVPARPEILCQAPAATDLACAIAHKLGHVGILSCEFFATSAGPIFSEMAPRVHNSGHWTIEGARTSQFENHVRAICGLPLGATDLTAARVEMTNLVGAQADGWRDILADPAAHLHLYGKSEARPGRKMGHVTRLLG